MKLSGDGARFTRSSNIVLLSFVFPELQENVLSGIGKYFPLNNNNNSNKTNLHTYTIQIHMVGNHTFAGLKSEESYEALSLGLEEVLQDLNSLISDPYVQINGKPCQLEFFLGGDYKVNFCVNKQSDKFKHSFYMYVYSVSPTGNGAKQTNIYLCMCLVHSAERSKV